MVGLSVERRDAQSCHQRSTQYPQTKAGTAASLTFKICSSPRSNHRLPLLNALSGIPQRYRLETLLYPLLLYINTSASGADDVAH